MSMQGIQRMVGMMVISEQTRDGMMTDRRAQLLAQFDLEPDEREEIMAIKADTILEFYQAIEAMVMARERKEAELDFDEFDTGRNRRELDV